MLTVNAAEQAVAYRALRRGLMEFELRQVYRGPEAYVDLPADPAEVDTRVAEALADHPDNDDLRAAVVLEASARKVVAVLQDGDEITVTGDGLKPVASGLGDKAAAQKQIRRGAVVRVLKNAKGQWSLTQVPEVEGGFVALDPRTGSIRALVGGFDYGKSKFNHVTQAWRQPGSSFKPFIYSAALEKGFTPTTVINDAPLFFDAGTTGSQPWEPKNYDGTFEGPMPLKRGLAKSKNMISIRILQSIGAPYAQQWVTRWVGHAAANGQRLRCVCQRWLPGGTASDRAPGRQQGTCVAAGRKPVPRRVLAHARRAQCLRDDHAAAGGHALRHCRARAGEPEAQ
jgi:penicillin-binding protein 1A